VAESDRLLSDCTPFKGVPRVRIPLSPPVLFANFDFYRDYFFNLALTFFNLMLFSQGIEDLYKDVLIFFLC
jgi:hypothetical protein